MKLDKTFAELWAEKEIKELVKKRKTDELLDYILHDRDYIIKNENSYTVLEHLTIEEVIEKYSWALTDKQIKLLKDDRNSTPQI